MVDDTPSGKTFEVNQTEQLFGKPGGELWKGKKRIQGASWA